MQIRILPCLIVLIAALSPISFGGVPEGRLLVPSRVVSGRITNIDSVKYTVTIQTSTGGSVVLSPSLYEVGLRINERRANFEHLRKGMWLHASFYSNDSGRVKNALALEVKTARTVFSEEDEADPEPDFVPDLAVPIVVEYATVVRATESELVLRKRGAKRAFTYKWGIKGSIHSTTEEKWTQIEGPEPIEEQISPDELAPGMMIAFSHYVGSKKFDDIILLMGVELQSKIGTVKNINDDTIEIAGGDGRPIKFEITEGSEAFWDTEHVSMNALTPGMGVLVRYFKGLSPRRALNVVALLDVAKGTIMTHTDNSFTIETRLKKQLTFAFDDNSMFLHGRRPTESSSLRIAKKATVEYHNGKAYVTRLHFPPEEG